MNSLSQLGQGGRPSEHARVQLAWAKESTIFSLKTRSLDRVSRPGRGEEGGGGSTTAGQREEFFKLDI